MKKLGVCVMGLGWMGRVHCEALTKMSDKVALFVASRDLTKAKEFSEKFNAEDSFGDYEKPFADERIHVIDICLPHNLHFPIAIKAFESGKHVLTEKPMALNLDEAKKMFKAARKRRKLLAIAENMRTYEHCVRARQLISEGAIGEPFFVQINHFAFYVPRGWRQQNSYTGGGSLIDVGHHYVDLAVMLGGKVKSLFANAHRKTVKEIDGEDTAILHLVYESGATGHLVTSFGMPSSPNTALFIVTGNEGSIYYEHQGRGLILHRKGSEPQVILPKVNGRDWWEETIRKGVKAFVVGFFEGKEKPLSSEEGLHDMAIIEAAYKSVKSQKVVKVEKFEI